MRKISYFYDQEIGNYKYAPGHPMKPHRIRLTHSLIMNYSVFKRLNVYSPVAASFEDLTRFHSDDYIEFLQGIRKENADAKEKELSKYNMIEDCPVFEGVYEYCQKSAGGSIQGAAHINEGVSDVSINWSGGLHHAKRREASGFCYVNDIVLGILELLRYNERVMYIDIDVHHGDGVEEAFYCSDRVMTISFHMHGEFFPGTGAVTDVGIEKGRGYSINIPLNSGIDDNTYLSIFKPVVGAAVEKFRPNVIVLQCGADSLAGDRLGCFNLTHKGHGGCVEFVKSLNIPILVLGGGGYTISNVSRAWAYETAILADVDVATELPYTEYFDHYHPNYTLEILPMAMDNQNTKQYIEKIYEEVLENIKGIEGRPSVQNLQTMKSLMTETADETNEEMWSRLRERRIFKEKDVDESEHFIEYSFEDETIRSS
ncbi:histone deacetylase 1/2 [Nematocida parisii]|uniref:Histone deacetylase n=1 Tax=Nematocida parisii (strain ERTm3) TaxID=935791 RepID=I3EH10_NEMP3|nr:histone deacetylase 1 [Nematocida parisii ERTm1]EIJ88507.1 histone deacetylase 1 [Nematocida parisii ERTm3]KAI5127775.1 histone deacetylase 1/2 [Nematocida parisii]EIJ94757.1 histone deacetylase 1 [Nematocida parisii ERTm1]KAI5128246.1 histone deacetylase 1/2 [Nematocida parisii]KAI5142414.1 histone deacetylase 1/2 [Nematocida parisii]|eukprot:XP_013058113.1 histone deacetylase 1 [Nematocida parisii ERTm1]